MDMSGIISDDTYDDTYQWLKKYRILIQKFMDEKYAA